MFQLPKSHTNQIDKYISLYQAITEPEELIKISVSNADNPYIKHALGLIYRDIKPNDEKWVFMLSDSFNLLGMPLSALNTLLTAFHSGVKGKFIFRRVINQLIETHNHIDAINFYLKHTESFKFFPETSLNIAKISIENNYKTDNFTIICEIIKNEKMQNEYSKLYENIQSFSIHFESEQLFTAKALELIRENKYNDAGKLITYYFSHHDDISDENLSKLFSQNGRFIRNVEILDLKRRLLKKHPHNAQLLLAYIEQCCFLKQNDEAWSVLATKINMITAISPSSQILIEKLEFMYLRLQRLFSDSTDEPFYRRGMVKKFSRAWVMREKSKINIIQQQNSISESVALIISGQVRGLNTLKNLTESFPTNFKSYLSTWEFASSTKPRLDQLSKIFPFNIRQHLPKDCLTKPTFRIFFPTAIKKLETEAPNSKKRLSLDDIKSIEFINKFDIENEEDFEKACASNHIDLKVSNRYNQAKMYYKIWKSWDNYISNESFDIVIRIRPDMELTIDPSTLQDCIAACREDSSLIYLPYLNEYGYGDQFALGSHHSMKVYCESWKSIMQGGFKYDECMEQPASHGAEEFLANHLLMHGIKIRLMPIIKRNLIAENLGAEVIDVRKEILNDFNSLDQNNKKKFQSFFDCYFSYANKTFH